MFSCSEGFMFHLNNQQYASQHHLLASVEASIDQHNEIQHQTHRIGEKNKANLVENQIKSEFVQAQLGKLKTRFTRRARRFLKHENKLSLMNLLKVESPSKS